MYQLKLATKEQDIFEFEKMRARVFEQGRELTSIKQGTFAEAIKKGDMLGFRCMKEDQMVGGMLVGLQGKNLEVTRIFVEQKERGQGAGTFMLNYVMDHQEFFEDYYGTDINCVVLEPIESTVDFCYEQGFDYSGFQMYKKYAPKKGRE